MPVVRNANETSVGITFGKTSRSRIDALHPEHLGRLDEVAVGDLQRAGTDDSGQRRDRQQAHREHHVDRSGPRIVTMKMTRSRAGIDSVTLMMRRTNESTQPR